MLFQWCSLLLTATLATALHCDKDKLNDYKLQEAFKQLKTQSIITDTPPSTANFTWYLNLCGEDEVQVEGCPKSAQICGVQEVKLPEKDTIVTEVIYFDQNLGYDIQNANKTNINIKLFDSVWGKNTIESYVNLECGKGESLDTKFIDNKLEINIITPGACLKSDKDAPPVSDPDSDKDKKKDDSWGWFTWLFIVFVLLFGGYIIASAWITASRSPADLQDAAHDFLETITSLVKGLPGFVGEVIDKIFGGSRNRGDYSAVWYKDKAPKNAKYIFFP